jgi:putative ABC transport system permease protein
MLKNYLIVAIRNLMRNKVFSFINIFGLSLGMALSILMLSYVYYQFSFDGFYKDNDRIYLTKVKMEVKDQDDQVSAIATSGIGVSLKEEMPELESVVRVSYPEDKIMFYNHQNYVLESSIYADSAFFDVFSLKLIEGDKKTALAKPFQIVLTERQAKKVFGTENPIGQILLFNNQYRFTVSGIVQDVPENSHLQFGALTSFATLKKIPDTYLGWNGGWQYLTYIKLRKNASLSSLEAKMKDFCYKHINYLYQDAGANISLSFEPLKNIHLKSEVSRDFDNAGNLKTIYILLGVALLVLFIAIINYINLSTARSMKRAKEVGVRKVLGASRKRILKQFMGESLIITAFSLLIALILLELFQPEFNNLLQTRINLFQVENLVLLFAAVLVVFLISSLAGGIPALYMSGFSPAKILRGRSAGVSGSVSFRKVLVFIQFFISAGLIVVTLSSFKQINFLRHKSLGFDKDQLIMIGLNSDNAQGHLDILKNEFRQIPEVAGVAASSDVLGVGLSGNGYFPEGSEASIMINVLDVDADFLSLMGIELVAGRNFAEKSAKDKTAYIINQALADKLDWKQPLGKYFERDGKHTVIGVVKDFNFRSLNSKIAPLIITNNPIGGFNVLMVKINAGDYAQTIEKLQQKWNNVLGNEVFDFKFLDELIENNYLKERTIGRAFLYFAVISVLIAALGLFGLSVFTAEQKIKEISVRKVFGAKAKSLIYSQSVSVLKTVILANVLVFPLIWYLLDNWLNTYAYHIDQSVYLYLFSLLISVLIALCTTLYISIKAANTNPAKALKYE